jgi:hypothetical protein
VAVEELALQTASRVIHLAFPETLDHSFQELEDGDPDNSALVTYKFASIAASSSVGNTPLLVFTLSPRHLDSKVMSEFVATTKVSTKTNARVSDA